MRVRALDVQAARIDGLPIAMQACTLAMRTEADGSLAWEASGWMRGPEPALAARSETGGTLSVELETDDGTVTGSAFVALSRALGSDTSDARVSLVGVGRLDPWLG